MPTRKQEPLKYTKYYFAPQEKIASVLDYPSELHTDYGVMHYTIITFSSKAFAWATEYRISKEDSWELFGERVEKDIIGCRLEVTYWGGNGTLDWIKSLLNAVKEYEVYK